MHSKFIVRRCGLIVGVVLKVVGIGSWVSTPHTNTTQMGVDKLPAFYTFSPTVFQAVLHKVLWLISSVKVVVLPIFLRPYKDDNKDLINNSYIHIWRFV